MLDNERWWHAREGYVSATREFRDSNILNRNDLGIYLSEQYKTQIALEKMGVTLMDPPSKLPNNPLGFVSVIGIPKADKTSTLSRMAEHSMGNYIMVSEDSAHIKNAFDRMGIFTFENFTHALEYQRMDKLNEVFNYVNEIAGSNPVNTPLVLFDRDWIDIPMIRANFLVGRLSPTTYLTSEEIFRKNIEAYTKNVNVGIVLGLIPPELSLLREGSRQMKGRIMQLPFLQVLYEQYVRFHYEMLNYKEIYGTKRNFIYSCVDTSNMDWEKNVRSLEHAINVMSINFL
jgi:hypothetical protein